MHRQLCRRLRSPLTRDVAKAAGVEGVDCVAHEHGALKASVLRAQGTLARPCSGTTGGSRRLQISPVGG